MILNCNLQYLENFSRHRRTFGRRSLAVFYYGIQILVDGYYVAAVGILLCQLQEMFDYLRKLLVESNELGKDGSQNLREIGRPGLISKFPRDPHENWIPALRNSIHPWLHVGKCTKHGHVLWRHLR